ncbi:MAG: hypothetical protein L0Z07_08540, partial [Planctomycetes bacterium]|nr:hypothetical protein [Planctomycetota bacterium]
MNKHTHYRRAAKNSNRRPRRLHSRRLRLEQLEGRLLLAGDPLFRINAGGMALAGSPNWSEDTAANPSVYVNSATGNSATAATTASINLSHASIPAGTPLAVFQSERFDKPGGANMLWDFPVTSGEYEVRLYFAETWTGAQAPGIRQFDVQIEGVTVLDNYDVFADVGGFAGVVKSFVVTSDANLDIDFLRVVQNPSIKGIEILSNATQSGVLNASTTSLDFGSVVVNNPSSHIVSLTNGGAVGSPDITIDPSQASIVPGGSPYTVAFEDTQPIVLGPGASTVVTVTYTPTTVASHSAVLNIAHSGSNSPVAVSLSGSGVASIPINFTKSTLAGAVMDRPTKAQFGPDGRLYVTQQNGLIRIFTIVKNGPNDYQAVAQEQLTLIKNMPNHNDDGTLNTTENQRLITGFLVTGTAQNPVMYVSNSDPRIGAGSTHEDLNLDTNSGTISRVTWNGSSWVKLDLVRGLPRSEENHGPNGLALDATTNTLYLAIGGNTNMGAPSQNFSLLPEYALAAAILSIDLNAIGETTYDLPTLDDEDRPGANDLNDPFGGNDGKNQAIIVPGGPVQVYGPGYRNPYDLHITTAGRMYVTDNGPNAGWGGMPIGEGPGGNATNDPSEPGITLEDQLHYVPGPGFYGGHPNPTRSNPANTFNLTNPQSPVALVGPNPIESDYLLPVVEDGAIFSVLASTDGLDEYTPNTFGGQLQGDLILVSFDNTVKRVKLNAAGDAVVFSQNLFSNVGVRPLDVEVVDSGPWAGNILVADIGLDQIFIYEPAQGGGNPNDLDGDGYTNDDEAANGTDPNNAGDMPPDYDRDFISNLTDQDDDNDSLLDTTDRFAIDFNNGTTTPVGTLYDWENVGPDDGGLLNLGFTGMMTNGVDDYESLFDPLAVTAGGAAGVFTIDSATVGTARGANNTQEQAFQFGVNVANETVPLAAKSSVAAPFSGLVPQPGQEMGMYIGTGDQDNYVQIVLSGDNGGSVQLMQEIGGVFTSLASHSLAMPGPGFVDFELVIDPVASTVQARYSVEGAAFVDLGVLLSIPAAWLDSVLAVGVISTDPTASGAMPVTWDYLGIVSNPQAGNAAAKIEIYTMGSIRNSSTARDDSFRIYNNSTFGKRIDSITIDLSTSFMPDMVYDPNGTAGDTAGIAFTPNTGGAITGQTGYTYSAPHDGGFDVLDVQFNDFDPGELFTFRLDVDPTSIKGSAQPGPGDSASISGLELSGATITVTFSDGASLSGQPFALNEGASFYKVHSEVVLTENPISPAPSLSLVGVSTTPAIVQSAAQTVRVTAQVGAAVRLLQTEVALHLAGVPGGGFDIDPFEANKVVYVKDETAVVGAAGFVDIPVTLMDT